MATGKEGTGKHPHKDTAEPYPHTKEGGQHQQGGREQTAGKAHAGSKPSQAQSGSEDLKEREYKDAQGNVHHHTKTYMDQHEKK